MCYESLTIFSYSQGEPDQPIWLELLDCPLGSTCLTNCTSCPSSETTACQHNQDVDIQCRESALFIYRSKVCVGFEHAAIFQGTAWIHLRLA